MNKNKNGDGTINHSFQSKSAKAKNYSLVAKIFHWGFVLLFVYGISKQVDELEQLAINSLLRKT